MTNIFESLIFRICRKNKSVSSLVLLLKAPELPNRDWKLMSERTWRTGTFELDRDRDIVDRARRIGSFTAWRSFESKERSMGLWLQVIPLATESDADLSVPKEKPDLVENPRTNVVVKNENLNFEISIPGVRRLLAYEQVTEGEFGIGFARYIYGSVKNFVFIIGCSKRGKTWDWNEVSSIAALQVEKIRQSTSS